jgi:hypothetical protein
LSKSIQVELDLGFKFKQIFKKSLHSFEILGGNLGGPFAFYINMYMSSFVKLSLYQGGFLFIISMMQHPNAHISE